MAGIVSTNSVEAPQTPVFDPYKELEVMVEKADTHAHAWGQTREIFYGDVWTDRSQCRCGAVRVVYRWSCRTSDEIRLPAKTPQRSASDLKEQTNALGIKVSRL